MRSCRQLACATTMTSDRSIPEPADAAATAGLAEPIELLEAECNAHGFYPPPDVWAALRRSPEDERHG
jgi:hypothetical protein